MNLARIDLGASLEGILDLLSDVVSRNFSWLDGNEVVNALHARQIAKRTLGRLTLVLSLHRSLESDVTVFDADLDLVVGNLNVPSQRVDRCMSDLRIAVERR